MPERSPITIAGSDLRGRRLRDLRISVTDRCNHRCRYCMPREHFGPDHGYLPRAALLSFEEISRLAAIFASLGVEKLRLTGGEPLLRKDIHELIRMLRSSSSVNLAMTSNGSLLQAQAEALAAAGLDRMTISLDSLHNPTFQAINDVDSSVSQIIAGIDAAHLAGLGPIKINAVIRRSINDGEVLSLAEFARKRGHTMRFIEFMDVGQTNSWRLDEVVPAREIIERIHSRHPIEAVAPSYPGEVARRYRYLDGAGELGVIASVTEPFCGACTRARLSADGHLFTCLFASQGLDLKLPLRRGDSDQEITALIASCWTARQDRYSELRARTPAENQPREMSYIGG